MTTSGCRTVGSPGGRKTVARIATDASPLGSSHSCSRMRCPFGTEGAVHREGRHRRIGRNAFCGSSSPSAKAQDATARAARSLLTKRFPSPSRPDANAHACAPQQQANHLRNIAESLAAGMRKSADSYARIECKTVPHWAASAWPLDTSAAANSRSATRNVEGPPRHAGNIFFRIFIFLSRARFPATKRVGVPR